MFPLRCPDCLVPGTYRLQIWLGFDQLAEGELKVEYPLVAQSLPPTAPFLESVEEL